MAQIGSFVPAGHAKIGICDKSERSGDITAEVSLHQAANTRVRFEGESESLYMLKTDCIGLHDRSRASLARSKRGYLTITHHS